MQKCQHHIALSSTSDTSEADYQNNEQEVGIIRRGAAGIIRLYQRRISPALPSSCRFAPTCSEYTRQAIIKHGILKGTWLGTKRILKCHPFHPGGHDPVP